MPVETTENFLAGGDDVFSQTVAPKGHVSMWCMHNSGAKNGFKSAAQVMEHGIPFGHGSNKVVKGWQIAMAPTGDGKTKRNIVKSSSGDEIIELYVDEDSMLQKQRWEANISNDQVVAAKGKAAVNSDPSDPDIKRTSILTDEFRDELETQQLRTVTETAPV